MQRTAGADGWMAKALLVIRRGGVVALPFERLYGLAADASNLAAVDRILSIKGQARAGRPIPVIIGDLGLLPRVAAGFSPLARSLADRYWPGLLTLLLPAAAGLPPPLVGATGLVGVRLPGPCPAADLARSHGLVLTATSANHSGNNDPLTGDEVAGLEGVDLIVPGTVLGPPGSTVVDPSAGSPRIVRQGSVVIEEE